MTHTTDPIDRLTQGVDLKELVAGMVKQCGKTPDEVKYVIPDCEQPTKLLVLFTDSTYMEIELTYPQNA